MMTASIIHADCRDAMREMLENSIDSVVTDPPYELGFMGKAWDRTGVANDPATWAAVARIMKPGAHLLAFSGTRTYHRMACAIEDAGFEIRDQIGWAYGQGFPKSRDIGDGWGTALKPAWEPIVVARKRLSEKTVQANVARWGVGSINIDGCRVATTEDLNGGTYCGAAAKETAEGWRMANAQREFKQPTGRWPANLIHDGSQGVLELFPSQAGASGRASGPSLRGAWTGNSMRQKPGTDKEMPFYADSGSAARFFYCAKASASDRAGSKHPTVKPRALMRYLCRLVTPPGGMVLDPFAGSGSTLWAAQDEGFHAVGIEQDAGYATHIRERLGPHAPIPQAAE